jgi:hypothetical protein
MPAWIARRRRWHLARRLQAARLRGPVGARGDQWRNWSIVFPTLPGEPGEGGEKITLWQMAVAMVGWIEQWIRQIRQVADAERASCRRASHHRA